MQITNNERNAILQGKRPPLVREGKCPFKKGETIVLQAQRSLDGPAATVSIAITAIKRGKKGEHIPEYVVRDDRGLYLAPGGGYTRSPSRALDSEAPVENDPAFLGAIEEETDHKNKLMGGMQRQREDIARKQESKAHSERSERAKRRHIESKSASVTFPSDGGSRFDRGPARPAQRGD